MIFMCLTFVFTGSLIAGEDDLKSRAWTAWEKGEIAKAGQLASEMTKSKSEVSSALHLLFLKAFMEGDYEEALRLYLKIDKGYERYNQLDKSVVNAYLHLNRYEEAEKFAISKKMEAREISRLKQLKDNPFKAHLNSLAIIPFATGPLNDYFPGFEAELNGQKIITNVDTGGTYLHMSPARAEEFGIELMPFGKGRAAGDAQTDLFHGIAESFRLGDVEFENVPVMAVAALKGQKFIIFGTNILQEFLSTLDYPGKQLILSPRNDAGQQKQHLDMLPENHAEIPFYMWGDHYMFARGAMGEFKDLNFFIDSGLVLIRGDENGNPRQAAFTTHAEMYEEWSFDTEEVKNKWIKSPLPLSLGPLSQEGHYLTTSGQPFGPFGGVKIHGLLSHAFLKQYTWTIDFAKRVFLFSGIRLP
jgi:hypothetical protein